VGDEGVAETSGLIPVTRAAASGVVDGGTAGGGGVDRAGAVDVVGVVADGALMLRFAFAIVLATCAAGLIVTAAWVTRPGVGFPDGCGEFNGERVVCPVPFITTTDTQTLTNKKLGPAPTPGDGRGSGMIFAK
jgi:hypothetical protein